MANYDENKKFADSTPEDIANVCCFLASELASYVSGQVITIDGAMTV